MASMSALSRLLLLLLSIVSFNPQYFRIQARHDCSGISLYYVLCNLIAFTEQFALGLFALVYNQYASNDIVNTPPTAGDWLNFFQHACVWLCSLLLFMTCLSLPPARPIAKRTVSAIYIFFLFLSVIPAIFGCLLLIPSISRYLDPVFFGLYFFGAHMIFINPIVTIIAFISLFAQARESLSRHSPDALSPMGLAVQAIIFTVVAICWPVRMTIEPGFWDEPLRRSLIEWYRLVGWVTVDNAAFAFVQAILLWIVMRRGGGLWDSTSVGESVPLVRS